MSSDVVITKLEIVTLLLRQSFYAKFRTLQRAEAVSNYFGMIVDWPIKIQITKSSFLLQVYLSLFYHATSLRLIDMLCLSQSLEPQVRKVGFKDGFQVP